jgi:glutamine synthetase
VLLKRLVKGVARRHGMEATFMSKPYGDCAGNGMHVHASILGRDGRNIFAGEGREGAPALRHAVAGLLSTMEECTAVFAPNANAYRRFRAGSHAPTRVAWGYDNRSAAVRVPDSAPDATRIEHRVSGADANPYLVVAAVLAGAFHGMQGRMEPPPAAAGNVYESAARPLPASWDAALAAFEASGFIAHYWGEAYRRVYAACKRQEKEILEARVTSAEYDAYLRDA